MIVSGSWQDLKIKNRSRIKEDYEGDSRAVANSNFENSQYDNPFRITKEDSCNKTINTNSNISDFNFWRYRLIIQKPTKLKDTPLNEEIQNGDIQIITPDFEDFCSSILHVSSRRELAQTVKLIAMMHGFRIIVPSGNTRELRSTFRCNRSRSRKTPTQLNRTWWPFAMIYSKVNGKPNYQLSRYRNIHNHPLDEFDMFTGIEVLHKVQYIVSKLKIIKDSAHELLSKAEEEASLENSKLPSEFDLDWEFNQLRNGLITVDKLTVLQPNTKSAWNSKIVQIDSLWKALVFASIEDGDIVDPEAEGKESTLYSTGVYLNTKEYDEEKMHLMKPRRLILEMSKLFERDTMEEYYPQFIPKENVDLEDDKYRVKQEIDIFDSVNLAETQNQPDWSHDALMKYSKLNRITEKISPYRIYEVPSWWDDNVDGDPIKVLMEYMPIYIMKTNLKFRFNDDEDSASDEGEKSDRDNQVTQCDTKTISEAPIEDEDNSDDQAEQDWNKFKSDSSMDENNEIDVETIEDAKKISNSINILSEITQEIEDDIDGREWIPNNDLKSISNVAKNQNSIWGIKRQIDSSENRAIQSITIDQSQLKECNENFHSSENSLKLHNSNLINTLNESSSISCSKQQISKSNINQKRQKIFERDWEFDDFSSDSLRDSSLIEYPNRVYKENWLPLADN